MRLFRRRIHIWTWARHATATAFLVLLLLGSYRRLPLIQGSISGTTVLGIVPLVDPVAGLESMLASASITFESLVGISILTATAILLGPVFCGWICPLGLLLDINQRLRRLALRMLRKTRPVRTAGAFALADVAELSGASHTALSNSGPRQKRDPITNRSTGWIRYALLGAVLGFAIGAVHPLFQIVSPINLLVRSMLYTTGPGLLLVALILIFEQFWPRLWCRLLCPTGAFYGLAGRFGRLRVWIGRPDCLDSPCRMCTRSCPMGIHVTDDFVAQLRKFVDHPSCIRCGECVDRCPRDIVTLGFRPTKRPSKAAQNPVDGVIARPARCAETPK